MEKDCNEYLERINFIFEFLHMQQADLRHYEDIASDPNFELPKNVDEAINALDIDKSKVHETRCITRRLLDFLETKASAFHQLFVNAAVGEFALYVDDDSDKYKPVFDAVVLYMKENKQP